MKTWRLLRGWFLLVVLAAGGWAVLHFVVLRKKPIEVRVARADRGRVERILTNTKAGAIRTRLRAEVTPSTSQRVTAIRHREGERVTAGEPLLELDDTDARAALAVAARELESGVARVREAEARLHHAQREVERQRQLMADRAGIQAELDKAETEADVAQASIEAARAQEATRRAAYEQAEIMLSKSVVTAPFDGVITELHIEVGEWAVPGRAVLGLLNSEQIYVRAELDEVDIAPLSTDLRARITLDPYRGRSFPGRVVRIAPFVSEREEQNRTVEVEVEFDPLPDGLDLKPGTSADVEVIVEGRDDCLRVPTMSILEGPRVLVARDGRAEERRIETGLRNWEWTEVTSGITEGDPVIVSLDNDAVKVGARVQIAGGETPRSR